MRIFQTEDRPTAVSGLDPRSRVIAAFSLAVLIVLLNSWVALAAAALVVFGALVSARAIHRATARRLTELNVFTLFLVMFMPISVPGAPVFSIGTLQWSGAGLLLAARIGVKANLVMGLCSALLATMEPTALAHALHRLGLPGKLAHALFFCVRYLEVLHHEYHRLRNAMRLRAFRATFSGHALRSLGYLLGMLFVRSVDRSDRILEAMKCRGFDGSLYSLSAFTPGVRDAVFGAVAAVAAGIIATLEWGL